MLVLGRAQVEELLDLDALIDALAPAMAELSAGRASVPDRIAAVVPEHDGLLAAMPGYVPSAGVLVTKLVSLFPRNRELPTHQAVIAAFDPSTGEPVALLDGTAITAARTGACSALSARLLARPDASVLAILGTGVQARSHAAAVCRVRPVTEVRVAGRSPAEASALASELAATLAGAAPVIPAAVPGAVPTAVPGAAAGPPGISVVAAGSYAEALDGADIACACTHSPEPVVRRDWLTPGVHVTSVGYNSAGREVDDATVAGALVVVESRRAALAPYPAGSNDLLQPIRDGLITADHVHAELGELVAGTRPGRTSPDQITLYKSVGVAVQDAAAAALVLAAARRTGTGHHVDF